MSPRKPSDTPFQSRSDRFLEEPYCKALEEHGPLLRPVDAARVFGMTRQYISLLVAEGKIPEHKLGGNGVGLVALNDLLKLRGDDLRFYVLSKRIDS